jgi:hypothetical protein
MLAPSTNMALVDYSDSDESDTEQLKPVAPPKPAPKTTTTNFSLDRASNKIRIKLDDAPQTNASHEDEPAAKRARTGPGAFSGFNSLLPPPKKDADAKPQVASKATARKVISLKTGAEPGFSREADAELKQFFAQQDVEIGTSNTAGDDDVGIPSLPKKAADEEMEGPQQTIQGNAFMFKPLSVGRNAKKKKPVNGGSKAEKIAAAPPTETGKTSTPVADPTPPPKKFSLFSMHEQPEPGPTPMPEEEPSDPIDSDPIPNMHDINYPPSQPTLPEPETLSSLATTLNLSPSQRRQLLGRQGTNSSALKVTNFSTDAEYLANESIRHNADAAAMQHNPVRAIASGKHSLRQLVNSAVTQKEALEESFAAGKRNKKAVGDKYGWG